MVGAVGVDPQHVLGINTLVKSTADQYIAPSGECLTKENATAVLEGRGLDDLLLTVDTIDAVQLHLNDSSSSTCH